MAEFISMFVPLMAFILVPLWIPLIATVGGMIADAVSPRKADEPEPRPSPLPAVD